jgi:hypothetical protein
MREPKTENRKPKTENRRHEAPLGLTLTFAQSCPELRRPFVEQGVKGKVMRKLVLKMSITLDGFVGGPNGEIDWILRDTNDQAIDWLLDTLGEASLHVMGSRTFKDMAAWWPTSDEPLAKPMNEIPKAVFSRTGNITAASTTQALVDTEHVTISPPL